MVSKYNARLTQGARCISFCGKPQNIIIRHGGWYHIGKADISLNTRKREKVLKPCP